MSGLTLVEYTKRVAAGELDPVEVASSYIDKLQQDTSHTTLTVCGDRLEERIETTRDTLLAGAPLVAKDNILTAGRRTTCASKILENYIAPYDATCFANIKQAGGLLIGKTNMDEFAMGGSSENSAFAIPTNPYDATRITGGSSGGSAAAVAADFCIAGLGTDTGGSVRQPASLCGIVGVKPTYGRVSRYGVQAMGSSLDQVGTLTKTVEDGVILLNTISGYDTHDATSVQRDDRQSWFDALLRDSLAGKKLALPRQFLSEGLADNVKSCVMTAIEQLRSAGAIVEEVDMPSLKYAIPVYYILMPAEASTNLARFDGIRYGLQHDTLSYDSIYHYYAQVRDEGFGPEVKRRILTGTYVLSAGFYDAYYRKAQQVRQKISNELTAVYQDYDAIIGPTSPTVARKIGEKIDDPIAMYLADIYTVIANLGGLPAMSVPIGMVAEEGVSLPVGLQIMCQEWREDKMFGIGRQVEKIVGSV